MITSLERAPEPTDTYWAADPDPEKVVNYLITRRRYFYEYLYGSKFFNRIARNWRYYHGLYHESAWDPFDTEIKRGGEEGTDALISVNHFRSILHLITTYMVQNRPAWDTKAINSDYKSMQQAKLGNDILDYYMDQKGVEEIYRRAIEESLIFSVGYVKITWNQQIGDDLVGDENTGQVYRSGDIEYRNPTIFDVVYDPTANKWDDSRWVLVRTPINKWELITDFPESREDILNSSPAPDSIDFRDYRKSQFYRMGLNPAQSDFVDYWEFYHERTNALPEGRYASFVGDKPLMESPLPKWCKKKPIYRITPAPYLLTTFGYTPAFDLQGPQEALNAEISTIVTNHKNLGPTKIWVKTGDQIELAEMEPGVNLVQSDVKPEPLPLCQTPREFFEFPRQLQEHMEGISGMNAVARGSPQPSIRSASGLALIDQKAVQYNSPHQANAYQLLADMGTASLDIFKVTANEPRAIYVAGVNRRSELREFQKDDLANISRVSVVMGNPLMKITAGRKEVAAEMMKAGMLKTPEEYLTLIETGQIRPLYEANDAQLTTCQDENEKLRNGQPVRALITDNQVFHILKHQSILDSTEMREHPIIAPNVLAHIKEHIAFLVNPECQWYQRALGYPIPLPAMSSQMPAGGEGEAQPGEQNQPVMGQGGVRQEQVPEEANTEVQEAASTEPVR